jgi:hypothetical protein
MPDKLDTNADLVNAPIGHSRSDGLVQDLTSPPIGRSRSEGFPQELTGAATIGHSRSDGMPQELTGATPIGHSRSDGMPQELTGPTPVGRSRSEGFPQELTGAAPIGHSRSEGMPQELTGPATGVAKPSDDGQIHLGLSDLRQIMDRLNGNPPQVVGGSDPAAAQRLMDTALGRPAAINNSGPTANNDLRITVKANGAAP